MKKIIIYTIVIALVIFIVAMIYKKYIRVDNDTTTVNSGQESEQTYRDFLISKGVPASEVDQVQQLSDSEISQVLEQNQ